MEDFYINIPSQMEGNETSYNDHNYIHYDYKDAFYIPYYVAHRFMYMMSCIIISIGLPLTLVAIYFLYSQVKNTNVAPIYIINLLISDIIQFCFMIFEVAEPEDWRIYEIFMSIDVFGLVASVCFMVCVALERYLVIAWPLWYNRGTIKSALVVCVIVWTLPLVVVLPFHFRIEIVVYKSIFAVFLLVPFLLLIFFLVGTLKALSAAILVPSDEKRRIVGMLVLVLLIYTLLFLPTIIWFLVQEFIHNYTFTIVKDMLLKLSPLADLILYFFTRKGVIDKLLASLCCCRMDSDDISRSSA